MKKKKQSYSILTVSTSGSLSFDSGGMLCSFTSNDHAFAKDYLGSGSCQGRSRKNSYSAWRSGIDNRIAYGADEDDREGQIYDV